MDGRELRRWMLGQPRLASVPVLVLSAQKPSDEASLMADAVLVKSVGMPHLLAAMSRALTRR
jgi:CheY-like chemotaxis protein